MMTARALEAPFLLRAVSTQELFEEWVLERSPFFTSQWFEAPDWRIYLRRPTKEHQRLCVANMVKNSRAENICYRLNTRSTGDLRRLISYLKATCDRMGEYDLTFECVLNDWLRHKLREYGFISHLYNNFTLNASMTLTYEERK